MNIEIYNDLLGEFLKSASTFDGVSEDDIAELKEDFETVIETIDINRHESKIDGIVKSTHDLLSELKLANSQADRQKSIEAIAMLRASIMDIESSLSNATDRLEKLVVSIRDA